MYNGSDSGPAGAESARAALGRLNVRWLQDRPVDYQPGADADLVGSYLTALESEVAALRQDAERWRFFLATYSVTALKDDKIPTTLSIVLRLRVDFAWFPRDSAHEVDLINQLIDAARAKKVEGT